MFVGGLLNLTIGPGSRRSSLYVSSTTSHSGEAVQLVAQVRLDRLLWRCSGIRILVRMASSCCGARSLIGKARGEEEIAAYTATYCILP